MRVFYGGTKWICYNNLGEPDMTYVEVLIITIIIIVVVMYRMMEAVTFLGKTLDWSC